MLSTPGRERVLCGAIRVVRANFRQPAGNLTKLRDGAVFAVEANDDPEGSSVAASTSPAGSANGANTNCVGGRTFRTATFTA